MRLKEREKEMYGKNMASIYLSLPPSIHPSIHMFASSEKCNKGLVY